MSGHSKWATTKRTKFASDAKKAAIFTKLSRVITVAAKEKGGDPETNFSLRLAIEKAKAANMPKDNIERAIKRGTGELEGAAIEEIVYEGFGPGKIPVILKCLTDNKNRTASNIKHLLTQAGGSLAGPNAVAWQFEQKGVILVNNEAIVTQNWANLELQLIDLGAQEIIKVEEGLIIYTKIEDLQKVNKGLETLGITVESADISYIAKEKITLNEEQKKRYDEFIDTLDDDEDIEDYYTNLAE